ncbi:hypothetical protein J6590_039434 [Homalodisca vitripennis]|nr:hypothetical protein J6590_039434 [Homalodisca vitripennis]
MGYGNKTMHLTILVDLFDRVNSSFDYLVLFLGAVFCTAFSSNICHAYRALRSTTQSSLDVEALKWCFSGQVQSND